MEKKIENQEISREEDRVEKPKLDLDKVLVEEVGPFGRYQFKVLAIALLLVISVQLSPSEYVFTAARIRTRCLIAECEDVHESFAPSWLANAVPVSGNGGEFDNCHRFSFNDDDRMISNITNDFCPEHIFDKNTIVPCDAYVYENKNSAVYDLGLACDEWRRSMIGFTRTLGQLFSHPLTGFISDRWGRRTALAFNAFNGAWIGLTRYFATSYPAFLITELIESIFGGGGYACVYILLTEMVGPKNRVLTGAISCTYVVMGNLALALLAWVIPNWRNLTLAIYTIVLFLCPFIFLITDSVRWLISKGQYEKATTILKNMALTNGKQLSTETLSALRDEVKSEELTISKQKVDDESWLVVLVFRHKPILLRCLITPVWWITLTLVYYGLTINSVNLKTGSKFTNFLAASLSEIPGFWVSYFLVNRIGRKPVLAGAYWTCALSLIAYIFVPTNYEYLSLALYMAGKFSISCAVMTVYLYTSELYPTPHRHQLFAFSSAVGRIGSILAPLTPAFGDTIPYFLFGGLAVVTGLLTMAVPETLGSKLPDTMEEAANLGKTRPPVDCLELR